MHLKFLNRFQKKQKSFEVKKVHISSIDDFHHVTFTEYKKIGLGIKKSIELFSVNFH